MADVTVVLRRSPSSIESVTLDEVAVRFGAKIQIAEIRWSVDETRATEFQMAVDQALGIPPGVVTMTRKS